MRFLTTLALLASLLLFAVQDIKLNVTQNVPLVDGDFSDACWQDAPWQEGFTTLKTGVPAKEATRFKILQGKSGLYLAIDCLDSKVESEVRPHDGMVWSDDCVEIFVVTESEINVDTNVREYYQFIVNAAGSMYESHIKATIGNGQWNGPWRSAVAKNEHGWQAEVFIPFAAFPNPEGNTWHLNVGRENKDVGISTWAKMITYSSLDKYNKISGLAIDTQRYNLTLDEVKFNVRPSDAMPFLVTKVKGAAKRKLYLASKIVKDGNLISFDANQIALDGQGNAEYKFATGIKDSGKYTVAISMIDKEGIVFHEERELALNLAPCTLEFDRPYRPNVILSKQANKTVPFTLSLTLPPETLAKTTAKIEVKGQDGKLAASQERKKLKATEKFVVDASKFPFGKYTIDVTLLADGKSVGNVKTDLVMAKPVATEVWMDEDKKMVVNGKPFFPVGFMGSSNVEVYQGTKCNIAHFYELQNGPVDKLKHAFEQAEKQGVKLIVYPFPKMGRGAMQKAGRLTDEQWKKIHDFVMEYKEHPALLAWFTFDEPRNPPFIAELKRIYEKLQEWDPAHPVIGNNNTAAGCVSLAEGLCDVIALDLYPNPRKTSDNRPVLGIYNGMQLMVQRLPKHGLWNIPQAFVHGESDYSKSIHRIPTLTEFRCYNYIAIVGGATAIMGYKIGTPAYLEGKTKKNAGIFASKGMMLSHFEGVIPELVALSPVILAETVNAATCDNSSIRLLTKRCNGKSFIFVVNHTGKPLGQVSIAMPGANGKWQVLSEGRSINAQNNTITDDFQPYAVHIYTNDLSFNTGIDLNQLQKKIDQK
ncbi:MAG: hypothetical protein IJS08_04035 [Victivallales bacterium]|nr:hypothetical protein [Victivallales bacterium]